MAKKWDEVAGSEGFKALQPDQQDEARRQYFDQVVAPQVPDEHRETAWGQFSTYAGVGRRELPAGVTPSSGSRSANDPRRLDAPTVEKTRAQKIAEMDEATNPANPGYQPMTENAVAALKTDARGGLDAKRTKAPGRVLDADIEPLTATSAARDIVSGALQIPGVAVKGVGDIARLATGDNVGKGLSDGAESVNKAIRENVGSWRAQQQDQRFQQDMQDPALNAADVVVGNPGALADQVLPTVGSMALPVGTAAAAGKLATAGRAAQLARAIDESTVLARAAKAREAAVIGTTAVQNAADTYSTIRDEGGDQASAYTGAAITVPATVVAGRLTGGGAEANAAHLLSGGAKGTVKAIPKAMAKEGAQEMGEEAGQYTGETVGTGAEFDADKASKRLAVAGTLGAVMGGGVEGAGAAREARIKLLRDAGDTGAADLLEQQHNKTSAEEMVPAELAKIGGNEAFGKHYTQLRTAGVKPAEAAARSAVTVTFNGLAKASGLPEKAQTLALEKAKDMPLEQVPGFFQRFTDALVKRGVIQPHEMHAEVSRSLEAARDDAMEAALGAVYTPVKPAMDEVQQLESQTNTEQATAQTAQAATETIAPESPNAALDLAAHDAATSPLNDLPEPTDAQKAAGNYRVGRVNLHGLNISIENPEGSTRKGVSDDGKPWENQLAAHYGYIRGTEGNDGDHVDTFIGPNAESQKVFVVDQVNKDGSFDEHKVLLGTDSQEQADQLYHANYHDGWTGRGAITEMSMPEFKKWVKDGVKNQPVAQTATPNAGTEKTGEAVEVQPTEGVDTAAADNPVVHLGRDNVPLTEGGRAFKTRKAADEARALNPGMRVVRAEGGFALTEKTPAQIAAQEAAAKRLSQPRTSPKGEPIPAHAMIAAAGGLHPDTRADMAMQGNVNVGNRKLFAGEGKGLTMERATERLIEEGYLPEGASHDQARDLIKRSLTKPQYTAEGTERMAAAELESRMQAQQEAVADVEPLSDNQFAELDADIPYDVISNVTEAEAMRAMGFTEQEIEEHAAAQRSRIQSPDSQGSGVADAAPASRPQEADGQRASPQGEDSRSRSDPRRQEAQVNQTPSPEGVSASGGANEFITAPNGSLNFGEITPEMSKAMRRQAGKIRLQQGNDKFGLQHIEARHGKEIRAAGFGSIQEFVADISKHIDKLLSPDGNAQLIAVHSVGNDRVMFIELQSAKDDFGDYYTVNTAYPARSGYAEGKKAWKVLWEARAQASPPAVNKQAPFAESPQNADKATTIPSGQSDASVPTRSPESKFTTELRPDNTLAVKGDPAAIREALKDIPAQSLSPMDGGILVGRSQAEKAQTLLQSEPPKVTAREAAEAGQLQRAADKKAAKQARRAEANAAPEGLSVGFMPNNAEPVTVKDGVVYLGKYAAQDFDTGNDVTVPAGATNQQIADALKKAGALGRKQRIFGLDKAASEEVTNQEPAADRETVELRKRLSVLNKLKGCLKS